MRQGATNNQIKVKYDWIKLETDSEILNSGTVAKVKYGIYVANTSQIDYNDQNYYYYGQPGNTNSLITLQASGLEEYISGISSDVEKNKAQNWSSPTDIEKTKVEENSISTYIAKHLATNQLINRSFLTSRGNKTVSYKSGMSATAKLYNFATKYNESTMSFSNVIKNNYDSLSSYNGNIVLKPGETKKITYDAETQLASGKDLEFNNIAQLKDVKKVQKAGRTISLEYSNFFDYAEKIMITPPTGENKDYTIYTITIISAVVILGAGIVFIKKIVLD